MSLIFWTDFIYTRNFGDFVNLNILSYLLYNQRFSFFLTITFLESSAELIDEFILVGIIYNEGN